ncbi:protein of unknown function DUF125 transmembrane [Zymomonas mobilis subsp. mobilis NCIMB 11163]|uniref:VIT1/CCC1 transporter family protein n=1 Tax=Zymomonas mobilis TaxID=542 RepID=UPI0001B70677|nr:VIT family protein [Zymomonas mobilis]ACV75891.1 protein of unknown function DUF125 transmembrane [Zymomonas mobilis subsp. mobilis NCIMB 11163]
MPPTETHAENHFVNRIGWLRAAVLGANDGIVSTASLITGVASAGAGHSDILLAGTAGLVAGAMSMAAGEYVSVSSQSDSEQADLARERIELETQPVAEMAELAEIYVNRGLSPELAREVAQELMRHDALEAHARDELGLNDISQANPLQAAGSSAASFTAGAALPLAAVLISPVESIVVTTTVVSLLALAILGAVSARSGGSPILRAVLRVTFWGGVAMAATAGVGLLFGTSVA